MVREDVFGARDEAFLVYDHDHVGQSRTFATLAEAQDEARAAAAASPGARFGVYAMLGSFLAPPEIAPPDLFAAHAGEEAGA